MSGMVNHEGSLDFADHGAEWRSNAVAPVLDDIRATLSKLPEDHAGIRISGIMELEPFLVGGGAVGAIAVGFLGSASRPVRAILFDKTAETNWSLGWHQDRTICVRRRLDVDGFGPWTIKSGMHHVAPPFDLLTRMVTLRVHLDDVSLTNAPLLIAPGSHRYGRIPTDRVDEVVRRCGKLACTAIAGDVWVYATPILHASESASFPMRRRVLQVDYAAEDLPGGPEWLGA
ncbi:phytanoyl-CoA dioxygenase family protein [uncultured Sphingomonas sp.]|uniref:phytanoyl-CoA dioxygenase family protein n=1 Tax=uncultured Sphingomonas sp. TaxID=158754 RepID=UPI0035CAB35C